MKFPQDIQHFLQAVLKELGLLSCFVATTALTFYHIVGELLWQLNTAQYDMAGDGLKNYYTFAYHYKHGNGWWFDGMLYPYGEHVLYTDGQPLLVWFFQGLDAVGLGIDGYELLALRLVMLMGFALAGYFIYKIGRHYQLPMFYALLVAVAAVAMSPQWCRISSHFSLAHAFVIPLTWYLLIGHDSGRRKWGYTIGIIILGLASGFLHAYLLMSVCLLTLAYAFVKTIKQRKINFSLWLAGVLPLLLFLLITILTDPITDRPVSPTGLLRYKTEVADLFPFYGYLSNHFADLLDLRTSYREGYCYLGILIFLIPIVLLYKKLSAILPLRPLQRGTIDSQTEKYPPLEGEQGGGQSGEIVQFVKKEKKYLPQELINFMWAGLLILAFAMGLHVMLTGEYILKIIPQLKQFRATGRLSWGFYYVGFVFLAVYWWHFCESIKRPAWRYTFLALAIVGWGYNMSGYHGKLREAILKYKSPNVLYWQTDVAGLMAAANRNADEFQAMFTLPSAIEGAEIFRQKVDWMLKTRAMPYSFQSGLPMTMCVMSRTSVSRALKVSQMASSASAPKEIRSDLPSDKPFLVLIPNEKISGFTDILAEAELIGMGEYISLYSLPVSYCSKNIRTTTAISRRLYFQDTTDTYEVSWIDTGDKRIEDGSLSKEALLTKEKKTLLADVAIMGADSIVLRSGFWYKVSAENTVIPIGRTMFYNEKDELLWEATFTDKSFERLEVYENWVRLVQTDTLTDDVRRMKFEVSGKSLWIDEVRIEQNGL